MACFASSTCVSMPIDCCIAMLRSKSSRACGGAMNIAPEFTNPESLPVISSKSRIVSRLANAILALTSLE